MKFMNIVVIAVATCALGLMAGCKKNPDTPLSNPPVVTTKPVIILNSTSVISGGEITNATILIDKGIIWGTDSSDLTVSSNRISNGTSLSSFTDTIQLLLPNTTYYIKAYAATSTKVSYGAAIKFTTPPTVYVAGYDGTSAAYWKDGKLFVLPGGTYAHSIYVVGNDVYVAGENNNGNLQAVYWKNGILVQLTDGTNAAIANSIFVVGNDVYVGGYELYNNSPNLSVATYWKNGVPVSLTNGTLANTGIVNSVFVKDSDVYAAGFVANGYMGYQVATYWKNGIAVPLNDSTKSIATAQSIFVSDSDVYVAGNQKDNLGIGGIPKATYWKNGTPVVLTGGSEDATAYSIFVNGNDVYASGFEYSGLTGYSVGKYWKNGVPVSLTDGTTYGSAYSIFVAGGDVYVAGGEDDYLDAKCWKNGVALPLEINAQYSRSVSIFVQ